MVTTPLLAALLALAAPAPERAVVPPAAAARAEPLATAAAALGLPRLLLADGEEDQGIGRGLRNMLVGGLVAGAGLGIMLATGALFVGTLLALGVLYAVSPLLASSVAAVVLGVGGLAGSALVLGGFRALVGGCIWLGVNGLMVLLRLSPGYKPGPATDYLPM